MYFKSVFSQKNLFFQIWGNMGLLSYRLAQAYSHLGPKYEEKSMEMYKKAEQVLSITHGKDHKLFTEISRKLSALSMC